MITVSNQKPVILNDAYSGSIGMPFDPYTAAMNELVKPLYTPLFPGATAVIDLDGTPLSENDVLQLIFNCSSDSVDTQSETTLKDIFKQTLRYYPDNDLSVQDVFAVQAGAEENLPPASDVRGRMVTYHTTEVCDVAKAFLAGQASAKRFFATVAFTMRVNTFGFYFANDSAWSDFKTWFQNTIVAPLANVLPPDTRTLCINLQSVKLNKLLEAFSIRDDDTQNNDDFSFARLFHMALMSYEKHVKATNMPEYTAGHMPFSMAETICPRTIVLVNVEKHAHARPSEVKKEWDTLQTALYLKPKVLGQNQIANLMAAARTLQSINSGYSTKGPAFKSAQVRLRNTPPTFANIYSYIERIYKYTAFVQRSENEIKFEKKTYNRASRRRPDDPDVMGKGTSKKYKPDLHLYLDGSGSISERMIQDGVKACIKLAKKMGVNLYFSSFSHYLAAPVKLHITGKTEAQIYNEFKRIEKATGGTDYEQIWHFINKSAERSSRVSIILSDFEYTAPNHYVKHPKYLFYAPITTTNWNYMITSATNFIRSMTHICPSIRKQILM